MRILQGGADFVLSGRRPNNSDARETSGTQRSRGTSLGVSQWLERSGSLVTADLARYNRKMMSEFRESQREKEKKRNLS